MKNEINISKNIEKAKINLETAKTPWSELQRFFAAGQVFKVAIGLDLTEIAQMISDDETGGVQQLLDLGNLARVSDQQALTWFESDVMVWCVVVKPFILVQDIIA